MVEPVDVLKVASSRSSTPCQGPRRRMSLSGLRDEHGIHHSGIRSQHELRNESDEILHINRWVNQATQTVRGTYQKQRVRPHVAT
jgi:hypothetical protein